MIETLLATNDLTPEQVEAVQRWAALLLTIALLGVVGLVVLVLLILSRRRRMHGKRARQRARGPDPWTEAGRRLEVEPEPDDDPSDDADDWGDTDAPPPTDDDPPTGPPDRRD